MYTARELFPKIAFETILPLYDNEVFWYVVFVIANLNITVVIVIAYYFNSMNALFTNNYTTY